MLNIKMIGTKQAFELIKKHDEENNEFWLARELMIALGYNKWENFRKVLNKAMESCRNVGAEPLDHFPEFRKGIKGGKGAKNFVEDFMLSRYACYLIAQNGDPHKEQIALAQTYFAIQTRRQEVSQENAEIIERLQAREKLSETEKEFGKTLLEHNVDGKGIAEIKSSGDEALFGGHNTAQMKKKLGINLKKPLADFLPTVTIKAKDLATEMTNFKTKIKMLDGKTPIKRTHIAHNTSVRKALTDEGIYPEELPAAEDIKRLEKKIRLD
jgi:DNA-damage-inducible protein D